MLQKGIIVTRKMGFCFGHVSHRKSYIGWFIFYGPFAWIIYDVYRLYLEA